MAEQFVCNVADLEPGTALRADLAQADGIELPVAVVRGEDGEFYAIADTCSHGEASLSEGDMLGCEIECWAHAGRFDFRTGQPTVLPALDPVETFVVRIDGERVLVDLDAPLPQKENA